MTISELVVSNFIEGEIIDDFKEWIRRAIEWGYTLGFEKGNKEGYKEGYKEGKHDCGYDD